MARKTTGIATTNRNKKTATLVQPAAEQVAPEVLKEVRKNGKPVSVTPVNRPVNLEEEIRRRAYELYLQRRATAGGANGDQNQDWLVAEREILSLQGSQEQHTA